MQSDLLKELLKKAREGSLVLPDFQRDFVWKPADVTKLLSSLLNGYPIGGLLFMESSGDYGNRLLDGVSAEGHSPLPWRHEHALRRGREGLGKGG